MPIAATGIKLCGKAYFRISSDPSRVARHIHTMYVVLIVNAGCATVAEVRKRGDDFWGEFEFYLSDLVVGCVLDCVLVGLLAPSAVIGAKPKTKPSGASELFTMQPA